MNWCFEQAPKLNLPCDIVDTLVNLDVTKLEIGDHGQYDMNPVRMARAIRDEPDPEHFATYYKDFQDICFIDTWHLPSAIEEEVLKIHLKFYELIGECPSIKLQAIHGFMLPIHADRDRTVAIVHPLKNHNHHAITHFYDHCNDIALWQQHYRALKDPSWPTCDTPWQFNCLPDKIKEEMLQETNTEKLLLGTVRSKNHMSIFDPFDCLKTCQTVIENFPTIINVCKPHAVTVSNRPSIDSARLSLNCKFRKVDFKQIVEAYHEYVQSQV